MKTGAHTRRRWVLVRTAALHATLLAGLLPGFDHAMAAEGELQPNDKAWWVAMDAGGGGLALASDQFKGARELRFALGLAGGHRIGGRIRAGLQVNGWLLQAYDYHNMDQGKSVSNVLGIVDVFPIRRASLFVRGGVGVAMYDNWRPFQAGSHGVAGTGGVGYEYRLNRHLSLAPIVQYSKGTLGEVRDVIQIATNRRYSVLEAKLGIQVHFGRAR